MASFDFIDVTIKGHEFVLKNIGYLFKVAIPILFVKVLCLLLVFVWGAETQLLRQGLILLPAFVLEALFIVGLIRYLMYREPIFIWGKLVMPPEKDDVELMTFDAEQSAYLDRGNRRTYMQAGIATYMLIQVTMLAFVGWASDIAGLFNKDPIKPPMREALPVVLELIIFVGTLASIIWLFRLIWLYVPTTMGYRVSDFMNKIKGLKPSIYMILTWLMCVVPLMMISTMLISIFLSALPEGSAGYVVFRAFLRSIFEILIVSVQVSAMTYAVHAIFAGQKADEKDE